MSDTTEYTTRELHAKRVQDRIRPWGRLVPDIYTILAVLDAADELKKEDDQ